MKPDIFPSEIIENSQESNFGRHSVRSKVIYSTIVLSVVAAICVLPFIKVDVGVRGQGMIRPVTEVMNIVSPVSAGVVMMEARENSYIKKGELIATLDDSEIIDRLRFIQSRLDLLNGYISDINRLQGNIDNLDSIIQKLQTDRYVRATTEFRQQLSNLSEEVAQRERTLNRNKTLYERDAISLASLEEAQFQLDRAENELSLARERKQKTWSLDVASFQREKEELQTEHAQLKNNRKLYQIYSPASGTLQNLNSLSRNSFIHSNQVIAELSPDTSLVAEVYIRPNDIGLLRENQPVALQVDAFDHNQWGTISGTIESISSDMVLVENTPVFKVRCTLDRTYLKLANGFRGELKKGMTIQARFIISRRSLFQLLYDNVDDWLNPVWSSNSQANS
jgi:HlyD family secretion protein